MKNFKKNFIPLLTLLLIFLQPVLSFGHVSHLSSEIVNTQAELALFKTKGSKALVCQEITISSVELVVSSASKIESVFYSSIESSETQGASENTNYLIDFRSIIASQIFPFHFFL